MGYSIGWLRLCTTVAMGMTITNCWKLFRYGVKREDYEKSIGIREFLERLAQGEVCSLPGSHYHMRSDC